MPIGWFIVPYKRRDVMGEPGRYCAMDDYTPLVDAEGGLWTETEILGDKAIVKVRASTALLSTLSLEPNFIRLPKNSLNEPLSDLSGVQKAALRDLIIDCGYTLNELQGALGSDLGQRTLRDVLRFLTRRRLKPRYDPATDTIFLDGEIQFCRSLESVDGEVF